MVRTRLPSPALGWLHPASTDVGSLILLLRMQCHLFTPAIGASAHALAICRAVLLQECARASFLMRSLLVYNHSTEKLNQQSLACSCTTAPHPGMLEM